MMWGNFLEKGRALAEKAKAAAADLDKQLNETVGLETSINSGVSLSRSDSGLQDSNSNNVLTTEDDDPWADDFQLDSPKSPEKPVMHSSEDAAFQEMPDLAPLESSSPIKEEHLEPQVEPQMNDTDVTADVMPSDDLVVEDINHDDDHLNEKSVQEEATKSFPQDDELMPSPPVADIDEQPQHSVHEEETAPSHGEAVSVSPSEPADTSLQPQVDSSPSDVSVPDAIPDTISPKSQTNSQDEGNVNEQFIQVELDHVQENDQSNEQTPNPLVVATSDDELNEEPPDEAELAVDDHDDEARKEFIDHEMAQLSTSLSDGVEVESTKPDGDHPKAEAPSEQSAQLQQELESQRHINQVLQQQLKELNEYLAQREEQLFSKTEQLTTMQSMYESEKMELEQKLQRTREEAKKRIQKAKERVEAMEEQFKKQQNATNLDANQQAEIIAALREEGESLARKQAEMEKAVRSAKGETRELKELLETTTNAKDEALLKIESLEHELRATKDSLAQARQGESIASKLEAELLREREESERRSASILSLEQNIKELKSKIKELHSELEAAKAGALLESEREQKKIQKQSTEIIEDLENKLRTSEREAAIREDALRHEVSELRKRWQDAVRRADALSMDAQSSTAPLLRQLESMERQNRARAAAWGDLETKLRAELEETVIANEKLSRERGDWKTKHNRLERTAKEHEEELKSIKVELEQRTRAMRNLEEKLETLEAEAAKKKEEYAEIERLANEGVARVRSEMSQRAVESEERHRSQLDALEAELRQERDKRVQLEGQVQNLVENAGVLVPPTSGSKMISFVKMNAKPKKLVQSQDQAQILAGALTGLDGADEDEFSDTESEHDGVPVSSGTGSFAALEELTSRLKVTKVELEALRKSLKESELTRERLVEELAESRGAKEKLPLFEERVKELTAETNEQKQEILALRDDIAEVRELYRTQLNVLLEEKAALATSSNGAGAASNGGSSKSDPQVAEST